MRERGDNDEIPMFNFKNKGKGFLTRLREEEMTSPELLN